MSKLNVETLNEERLKKSVDADVFEHGKILYLDGRVQITSIQDAMAHCLVQDKHPYRIEIKVAKGYLYLKCDCRYAFQGLICEHDIAACLAIKDVLQQRQLPTWRNQIGKVIGASQLTPRKNSSPRYLLFFSLQESTKFESSNWRITAYQLPQTVLSKLLPEQIVPSDEISFQSWVEANPKIKLNLRTPYYALDPAGCINCSPQSVVLANILLERPRQSYAVNTSLPIEDALMLLADSRCPLYLGDSNHPLRENIQIVTQPGEMKVHLDYDPQGIHIGAHIGVKGQSLDIKLDPKAEVKIIAYSPFWILVNRYLLKLSDPNHIELLQAFQDSPEILIPAKDAINFQKKYYLSLAEKLSLDGNLVEWINVENRPIKRVYLTEAESGIQAELRFGYEEYEVAFDVSLPQETILQKSDSWILVRVKRRPDEEKNVFNDISSDAYGLKRIPNSPQPGLLSLRARLNTVDFLLDKVPRLISQGYEVYGEEQLTSTRVNRNDPTISFQVSSGIDWFDVKAIVNFGELEISLKEVRRAIRKKERFIRLPDGTIGAIPEEWSERYKHLFALGHETEEGLRLARHHLVLIDQVLDSEQHVETDRAYLHARQQLLNFSGITPRILPREFNGELRHYQKSGYDWLHFLHEYGFGGCLADDMGLGKTVQVLVFLQDLKETLPGGFDQATPSQSTTGGIAGPAANLIVVPRSLLINWQREAARFTPSLRILEYFETNRSKDLSVFDQYDLVITTYGVMLRDLSQLRNYRFHYIILDESQAIKNPASQTARAARMLQSSHRLVLTGTPVENSTQELWSQFAFLNPGLLGNLDYFKEEFILPIEKKGDERATLTLRRIVYPFILRRTKDQVAPELPPRSERILYCDMEPAQRRLYNRTRDYYRGIVLGMLEKEGINNTRFRILEGLLRLRQISNHPRLMDDKFRGESGKFELLLDTIETLQAEGHKALLFSQFVQMLRILREPMDLRQIPYVYLDGHTRNRMELVDNYQNNPRIPFFLISLKAGGQGLNLTAADYVIHIDPWWNPAVEMQASDRTHRIGQEKPVFIFKLITRDSVEEKIVQLQERKKKLIDQLVTTESGFFKSLTPEDIQSLFS
jgi:non-specific serine/threonine protein kinase